MSVQIIPYVVNVGANWVGVDILNYSEVDQPAEITIYRHDGSKHKAIPVVIGSMQHHIIAPDDFAGNEPNGRYTVVIEGNKCLLVTPCQGKADGSYIVLPVLPGKK